MNYFETGFILKDLFLKKKKFHLEVCYSTINPQILNINKQILHLNIFDKFTSLGSCVCEGWLVTLTEEQLILF